MHTIQQVRGAHTMEKPESLKAVTLDYMKSYVMEQKAEDIQWLINAMKEEIDAKDKDGKDIKRKRSFLEIRNDFARRYFPDLAPKGTTKKAKKMKDILTELEAALADKQAEK